MKGNRRVAWWHKGLSLALSVAMVMASTPTSALAEALDEAGAEDVLFEVIDDEGVAEGEGTEATGDEDAVVADVEEAAEDAEDEGVEEDTEAEGDEDALTTDEDENAEDADEAVAPEATLEETPATGEEAATEDDEPASELEDDLDIELKAQSLSVAGDLVLDGEWRTSNIEGTDVAAYKAATDSDGRMTALAAQVWRVTLSQSVTLSADIWSKGSLLHWWITDDSLKAISSENEVAQGAGNTLSVSVAPGTYYIIVASATAASGNYALRAYTAKRALAQATFNGKAAASISTLATKVYNGAAQTPAVTVQFKGVTLTKGIDYTIAYTANKKVGTASITIRGKGLYSGSKVIKFKIVKRSIKKTKVTIGVKNWTGKPIKPKPTVKIGKVKLKKGVDYTIVRYVNNKNAGTAKVVIKGKGGLKGTRTIKFKIRYNISKNGSVTGYYRIGTTTFTKFVFKKRKATMKAGRDYRLSVVENSSSKKVYKMVGKGLYRGTTYFTFYK